MKNLTKTFLFRMTEEEGRKIAEKARREQVPVSHLLRRIVRRYLSRKAA